MTSTAFHRPLASRRIAAVSLLAVAAGTLGVVCASPGDAAVQGEFLRNTPGTYSWTVPAGVNTAQFDLSGGSGGNYICAPSLPGYGGLGGHVSAVLSVIPGDTYTVTVGGAGGNGCAMTGGAGGYNGGGHGGDSGMMYSAYSGGGGGGASDVRRGGGALADRILVAGGGGGMSAFARAGGAGGGLEGGAGASDDPVAGGGTQSAGGARGGNPWVTDRLGLDGGFGFGGFGGIYNIEEGGGGGGGGWYGGGGADGGTGGGGSSYVIPQAGDVVNNAGAHSGDGSVQIEYGTTDAVAFAAVAPPSASVGSPYSYRFVANGWPVPQYYVVGTVPAGLSFNETTGVLAGTPTTAGTYSFKVAADNGESFSLQPVTVTVQGLPTLPKVSIAASSETEPASGTAVMLFPVTLDRASTVPVSVHWATKNGTAKAGSDYVAGSGTLTFTPGSTFAGISVLVKADKVTEANETLMVTLTSPVQAKLGTAKVTGTIKKPVNP